jgi:uncharacterized membrane protein YbhN (UPF0104 family)
MSALTLSTDRRLVVRRALSVVVSLGIVVGIFYFFLPQFTSVSSVWRSVRAMSTADVLTLCALGAWNLVTYWVLMVATMPGLTHRQAMVVTESSTAVSNTLPGGGAIGIALSYTMYSSWGFSKSRSSVSLLVMGVWNNFAKLGMPVLALVFLALDGGATATRLTAAALGLAGLVGALVVFALMLRSEAGARAMGDGLARLVNRVLERFGKQPVRGWDRAIATFRARTIGLLAHRWVRITLLTVVSHLSLFLVLLFALRSVGVGPGSVSWAEALAVFSFARLVTAIPLTPGGLGVVELALITGLAAAGGARAEVAAAVLVFRVLTYVVRIPLGLGMYLYWRGNRSWRRAPGTAPRPPIVVDAL